MTAPPEASDEPMTYAGGASDAGDFGHLRDLVDLLGGAGDTDRCEDRPTLLDEEHVDARVDVEEHLSQTAGALRIVPLDGAHRRRVHRQHARGERLVGEVVVELLLEPLLGAGDAVVHFVDQLPAQKPREHEQRGQHRDGDQRDERRELGANGREADGHANDRAYRRSAAIGEPFGGPAGIRGGHMRRL